jgi:hypothetical protein
VTWAEGLCNVGEVTLVDDHPFGGKGGGWEVVMRAMSLPRPGIGLAAVRCHASLNVHLLQLTNMLL